jgi:hypothetical protein
VFRDLTKTVHVAAHILRGKGLYGLFSIFGGAGMKKIVISAAIILVIILTALSLQGCFTPYPEKGDPDRAWRDKERTEQWWWDSHGS